MKWLVTFSLLLSISLCYSDSPHITVGTTTQNPPFSSIADQKDHFYGFDIDVMGEICQRIKYHCQFTPVLFNDLFTQIKSGKIDLAIAAIIITGDRKKDFLFSLPYLESSAQFMTEVQSSINKPEDVKNKRIGVRSGTRYKDLALTIYNNQVTITEYPSVSRLLDGLHNEEVDVIFLSEAGADYWYVNNSNLYKLIGSGIPIGGGYGIMANLGQEALMAKVNQALLDMEADGTYLGIYTRYFSK